jgi:hypothetical protein
MKPKPYRRPRNNVGKILTRAFVWIVLTIFVLTSVGVALVAVR